MSHAQDSIEQKAKRVVNDAQNSDVMELWMRLGYAARGILYFLIGFLAIQLIITGRGKLTDQAGALATVASQPYGRTLLIIIMVGLTGYAMYCFIRAIFDPFNKGKDAEGIISRLGYFVTGVMYGLIVYPAYQMFRGAGNQSGGGTAQIQQFAAGVLNHSWGPLLVGLVGLVIVGIGIYEIYYGWKEKFTRNFESYRMSGSQRKWSRRAGKFGYIALGVVFAIIGGLSIYAALTLNPQRVGGIDASLAFLIQQPYGMVLLGLVALGLIAYAIYSIMGAIWFKIKTS